MRRRIRFARGLMRSTPTFSAPARGLWQTDTIGLKIAFDVSWARRDDRAVAWLMATNW